VPDLDIAAIGSAAPGHHGAAATGVTLAETSIAAAWNVQGDPARPEFADDVWRLFGVALPQAPNTTAASDALTALWLGPTSWLLVAGSASPLADFAATREALNARGGALFDLTASRVAWTISGAHAATVLATSCPLDLHPRAFAAGTCAQSVLGHINALIVKRDLTPTFTVLVARSFARDVWHALCLSAAQHGYDVTPPTAFR
jgi:sarcosine oxidase subunit gamma